MTTRKQIVCTIAGAALLTAAAALPAEAEAATEQAPAVRGKTVLSRVYTVDQLYKSMKGPASTQNVELGEGGEAELMWITGYEAVMVGADGESSMAQEFMCHSNLDVNVGSHREAVGSTHGFNPRLFTLSQGQLKVEFPEGFGIPVLSSESLGLTTQVLNHNLEGQTFEVRHRVTVHYVRDGEAGEMKALFPVGAYGLALLEGEDGYFGVQDPTEEQHGPGCLPGSNASGHTYRDHLGRTFTGHWVVPPGREVNRTLVTELMQIPYDSTVHYIAVHLHPFAESLELRDLTAGTTVFKSAADNFDGKIGLANVEYFASPEGLPLYKEHEYEMVSVYHNTTEEPQDSMAVMYLYLHDKVFDKERVKLAAEPEPLAKGMTSVDGSR
jgi:hypothetical protein